MKLVKIGAVTLVTLVILAGIAIPTSPEPASWFQFPVIPALEEKARNIFFHVPTAWTTVVAFLVSMVYGIQYLRTKKFDYDMGPAGNFDFCSPADIRCLLCASIFSGK